MTKNSAANRSGSDGAKKPGTIVAVIAFAGLMGTLMQSLVVPVLGDLPNLLHTSPAATSWLVTAMLLSGAVSNVVFGRLGDMFGKRLMIIVCLLCMLAGSVLGALTSSLTLLIVARVLQGVTMAVIPLGISALSELLSGQRLVKGIALVSAMVGIGGSLGFTVAAAAAQFISFHALFGASAVLAVLALVGVFFLLPAVAPTAHARFDVIGVIGLTVGLVAVLIAISQGGSWGWGSPAVLSIGLGGILVLILWGIHQLHITSPLIDLRTASRRPVLMTNLATLLVGFTMYGVILAQPRLVQLPAATGFGLGLPVVVAGLVVAPGALVSLVVPQFAAKLTTHKGPKFTMYIGAATMAVGYLFLMAAHTEIWELVLATVLITGGVSFCFGTAPTLIISNVPPTESGQANGINNLARSFGTSTSSAVTTAILAGNLITTGYGARQLPSESAFSTVFCVCAVASVAICVFIAFVPAASPGPRRSGSKD